VFVISLEQTSDTLIFMKNKKAAMATLEIGIPAGFSVIPIMAVRWNPTTRTRPHNTVPVDLNHEGGAP
jgi:hypothetical protein